jgi:trans-aconitate 2-methyltransferase
VVSQDGIAVKKAGRVGYTENDMGAWSPQQYQKFSDLRNRACRDLAVHVEVPEARRVVDLGCGPGNLGGIAPDYWPRASIKGIDSSPAMIETARQSFPRHEWVLGDISEWAESEERCDIVFSNAALQWAPNHGELFPKLLNHVNPGGALAVQMPGYRAPQYEILREMAAAPRWRRWFPEGRAREWRCYELDSYHDLLKPRASRLDLWATEYWQVMADVNGIVEFYKSTGLRPYLDPMEDAAERQHFLDEYAGRLGGVFPRAATGEIFFPMRRIFIVARLD